MKPCKHLDRIAESLERVANTAGTNSKTDMMFAADIPAAVAFAEGDLRTAARIVREVAPLADKLFSRAAGWGAVGEVHIQTDEELTEVIDDMCAIADLLAGREKP